MHRHQIVACSGRAGPTSSLHQPGASERVSVPAAATSLRWAGAGGTVGRQGQDEMDTSMPTSDSEPNKPGGPEPTETGTGQLTLLETPTRRARTRAPEHLPAEQDRRTGEQRPCRRNLLLPVPAVTAYYAAGCQMNRSLKRQPPHRLPGLSFQRTARFHAPVSASRSGPARAAVNRHRGSDATLGGRQFQTSNMPMSS